MLPPSFGSLSVALSSQAIEILRELEPLTMWNRRRTEYAALRLSRRAVPRATDERSRDYSSLASAPASTIGSHR